MKRTPASVHSRVLIMSFVQLRVLPTLRSVPIAPCTRQGQRLLPTIQSPRASAPSGTSHPLLSNLLPSAECPQLRIQTCSPFPVRTSSARFPDVAPTRCCPSRGCSRKVYVSAPSAQLPRGRKLHYGPCLSR